VDLELFSSPTSSVETSTLGMDLTFSTYFPSSSVSNVEKFISHMPQEDIIKIHEELENLQNQLSDEEISNNAIPIIDSIHPMLEDEDGIEVACNLAQIFGNILPKTSGVLPLNTSH
jgi:hypothetical protein